MVEGCLRRLRRRRFMQTTISRTVTINITATIIATTTASKLLVSLLAIISFTWVLFKCNIWIFVPFLLLLFSNQSYFMFSFSAALLFLPSNERTADLFLRNRLSAGPMEYITWMYHWNPEVTFKESGRFSKFELLAYYHDKQFICIDVQLDHSYMININILFVLFYPRNINASMLQSVF